jgi:AcrR family transcriptional regulator
LATSGIGRRRAQARAEASQHYLERRSRLIAAAAEVFQARGFTDASLDEIARAADIDRASVYYYVSGKRELFYAVVLEMLRKNALAAEQIAQSSATAGERITELSRAIMQSYEEYYPSLFVFLQEDLERLTASGWAGGEDLRALMARIDRAFVSVVKAGIASGEFRPDLSPRVVVDALLGMINWSHRWFRPGAGPVGEEVGGQFASILREGITRKPENSP